MSREAIARVREAEARAADIRAQATAKAQQMRTDNEKACAEKHDVRVKEMSAALRAGLDSMQEKADALVRQLAADGMLANRKTAADETYYTSGDPDQFAAAAKLFLGRDIRARMRRVEPAPIDIACKIGYNFPPTKIG